MNPDLDLGIDRVIRAPRKAVWNAWTDPANFAQWWIPAPTVCRVERLEVRPGGGLVTSMSDDGDAFVPHLDACFLVIDEYERIVFTNAIDSQWRPAGPAPVAMTAEVVLRDHPDGTDYRITVRHGDAAARNRHADLGFADGWGTTTGQLARVAESLTS
ncbi:SRPBCC domain-containing protein [Solicola gregarius]|uniref:SRPBCC domain-containing protein n=1 Tax=Solicola gregarius TaxID=2908642 RepID=A0AA46YM61_9ACTN|nr:SRPBCC domain-containing protein [Solicola gregarius]UYM07377.1 SRPBCC domain-containing protein [Solicola gregarius]